MKKVHRKGAVHPSPPVVSDHLLSLLPTAILFLTAALSAEEKEVLAYLISCSTSTNHTKTTQQAADHSPCFSCNCFRCYMSYWVKWDSSPNRHLIHEIIDGFEENLPKESKKNKKERNNKAKKGSKKVSEDKVKFGMSTESAISNEVSLDSEGAEVEVEVEESAASVAGGGGGEVVEVEEEKGGGSVRRFMGFLGGRIWSVWG